MTYFNVHNLIANNSVNTSQINMKKSRVRHVIRFFIYKITTFFATIQNTKEHIRSTTICCTQLKYLSAILHWGS